MSCPKCSSKYPGTSQSGLLCSFCGDSSGEYSAWNASSGVLREEWGLRAVQVAEEVAQLVPTVQSYATAIRRAALSGHHTTYNLVKYGLDVERLLRGIAGLLRLVIEMQTFDPVRQEKEEKKEWNTYEA